MTGVQTCALPILCTLSMGGAEKSLISMLNTIDTHFLKKNDISIDLLVADTSGVFYKQIPLYVNKIQCPYLFRVLASRKESAIKRSKLTIDVYVLKALWKFFSVALKEQLFEMEKYWKANKKFIPKLKGKYDVCLAYMNGMTTYYAIDKVKAKKKFVGFIMSIVNLHVQMILIDTILIRLTVLLQFPQYV